MICPFCDKRVALHKSCSFVVCFFLQCACGGYFKPDAILFGEGIPSQAVRDANKEADACDLMLVVGTSATVHPAADIPYRAMRGGAKVIEVRCDSLLAPGGVNEQRASFALVE